MAWVSVHQEVDGSKLRRLYKTIGCSKFEALGILNFLWFWGMKNADETGLVSDADLEVLSRYLYGCGEGSTLDMGKVVQALADVGWIDMAASGFYIHDWDQWQEQWYKLQKNPGEVEERSAPEQHGHEPLGLGLRLCVRRNRLSAHRPGALDAVPEARHHLCEQLRGCQHPEGSGQTAR